MKINVKALLLWGIIFPFIISTLPLKRSSTQHATELKLVNTIYSEEEIEQILDILEISINGTYGEFIHNNVINSIASIDQGLLNNNFSIIYFSKQNVDSRQLITSILEDEKRNLTKLQSRIYELLTQFISSEELPDEFRIKIKVVIPNKRISNDKIRAYELELEVPIAQYRAIENHHRAPSDTSENAFLSLLDHSESDARLRLTALQNEL
ncbi:hypothetical protein JXJ21_21080 [candidate division KSB1 bacterium]|nr:hypothetical protein [candidate division KSB1 bacterium]